MTIDLNHSTTKTGLKAFFDLMKLVLDEKQLRLLAGGFILYVCGGLRGSISWMTELTGISRDTIRKGRNEIQNEDPHIHSGRVRRLGGGRKRVEDLHPEITAAMKKIVERESYGNPQNKKCRLYCALSLKKIIGALQAVSAELKVCPATALRLIRKLGYSKLQNKKALQIGRPHPDRNEQMEKIRATRDAMAGSPHNPVISIDAKAKVFFSNLFQKGRQWRRKKDPEKVLDHDFPDPNKKATPYGVYDLANNLGFVNLGISHDTAQFAVESIRRWWYRVGAQRFPQAERLTVLCDGGGSNGFRLRSWKYELAKLADELQMPIRVQHYPSGCSKFNLIEHRMFNIISMNWAGKPFTSLGMILKYIRSATTQTGLRIIAMLDRHKYETKVSVSDDEFARIRTVRDERLGQWNYEILGLEKAAPSADAA